MFGWTVGVRGPRSGVHSTVYSKVLQERDFGVHSSVELCTPQLWSALQQHAKIEECTTLRWSARQKKSTPMDSTENFVLNRSKKAGPRSRPARKPGGRETPVEPVKSTRAKQGGANYDFKRKNLFSIQSKAKASASPLSVMIFMAAD